MSKDMVVNPKKKTLADSIPHEEKPPKNAHEGETARTLNFRDRDLIVQAVRAKAKEGGGSDWKVMRSVRQVEQILKLEECLEYFEMHREANEDAQLRYADDLNAWIRWQNWRNDPNRQEKDKPAEIAEKPEKPKDATPKELRGDARKFWIPSKLDGWIQDALKAMKWSNPIMAEFIDELSQKYDLKE